MADAISNLAITLGIWALFVLGLSLVVGGILVIANFIGVTYGDKLKFHKHIWVVMPTNRISISPKGGRTYMKFIYSDKCTICGKIKQKTLNV